MIQSRKAAKEFHWPLTSFLVLKRVGGSNDGSIRITGRGIIILLGTTIGGIHVVKPGNNPIDRIS